MRRILADPPLSPLCAARGRSRLPAPDRHLRGAARAALGLHARRRRSTRSPPSASPACASSSTGATSRPSPDSKTKPAGLRRERPRRLSRGQVGQPRRAGRRGARSAACPCTLTLTGPGAEVGDARQARQRLLSGRRRSSARSRPRSGAATATRVDTWSIWNEPNQPQFLSRSTRPASRTRRSSTASSTRRPTRACARRRPTRTTRSCSARPRRAATRTSSTRSSSCAGCCAWTPSTARRSPAGELPADGYAHHAYTTARRPALGAAERPTT